MFDPEGVAEMQDDRLLQTLDLSEVFIVGVLLFVVNQHMC